MAPKTRLSHADYTVGWICALPLETAASRAMMDELHDDLPVQRNDHNAYILGRIGDHNVVIACLPSGEYGIASAATVAMQLLSSFQSIRFGLLVGIGGGVPSKTADIRLGDVVVSKPTGTYGGVIQYDYGKAYREARFENTGMLNRPPQILLTALAKLRANHEMEGSRIPHLLAEMGQKYPQMQTKYLRAGHSDHLFAADYMHDPSMDSCDQCDLRQTVQRLSRQNSEPVVHYGIIASGNRVVKDSGLREHLRQRFGALCVEMEAAGLMNNYPCMVIRGICDYADSHKIKDWQEYAASVAAAYAKELLSATSVASIDQTKSVQDSLSDMHQKIETMVENQQSMCAMLASK
jgi:nucleoside phosphorylase